MCNRWNQPGTVLHRRFFENSRAGEENQSKVADKGIDRREKIGKYENFAAISIQPFGPELPSGLSLRVEDTVDGQTTFSYIKTKDSIYGL